MARSRILKPTFFTNEDLAALPFEARLLFAGLWTLADRQGIVEDRPRRIKACLFPYDELDVDALLQVLYEHAFIHRYAVGPVSYLHITNFLMHQNPHPRESKSSYPLPGLGTPKASLGHALDTPSPAVSVSVSVSDSVSVPNARPRLGTPKARLRLAFPALFVRFWDAYPRKVGKGDALKAWEQLDPDETLVEAMLDGLAWQREQLAWTKDGGEFIPHPATWLRAKRWLDERVTPAPHQSQTARAIAQLLKEKA